MFYFYLLEADIIHFGTHSIFHRDNVYHFVRNKAGKLIYFTKDDLYKNPYLCCNLLIFNSCQSGEGKYIEGEGVMSIVHPVLYQDISNILVTLNPIQDNSSSELMLNFLKYISQNDSYSVAINKAKRDIKDKGLFPNSWTSYIFIGTD